MRKVIILVFIILLSIQTMAQNEYTRQWKKVDSLQNLGQVKTALEEVMSIYSKSKTKNQSDQTLKALLFKIRIESQFEEEYFKNGISFINDELKAAQPPVKQLLYSILGDIYLNYYRNTSWIINQRTSVLGTPSEDIDTWDTKTFIETCKKYYLLSLTDAERLQKTPLNLFETILEGQKESRKFRPTLYDFLVFRAIGFFSDERSSLIQPSFTFKIDDEKYFGITDDFIKLKLVTQDIHSFDFQVLKLYQDLLRFQSENKNELPVNYAAHVDADLNRLAFIYQKCNMANKDKLYINALRKTGKKYENQPESADIWYQLAVQLNNQGDKYQPLVSDAHKWDKKEAFELATKTIKQFPKTTGAQNCQNLIFNIRQSAVNLTGNYANPIQKPSLLRVGYTNINKLWIRIIKSEPKTERDNYNNDQNELLGWYLTQKPVSSWNIEMPSDGDFQPHAAEIKIPALPSGYFVVLASASPDFEADSLISYFGMWSTDLSLVSRRNNNGTNEIIVLNRKDGQPVPNVIVQPFYVNYDYRNRKYTDNPGQKTTTDVNGIALIKPSDNQAQQQFYVSLTTSKDKFIPESVFSGYRNEFQVQPVIRTHFFTDRAIYRPGQTIYFKGIILEKAGDKSEIRSGFKTKVSFNDVNGKLISSLDLKTNEYGSFSGSFIAPQSVLTGNMTLFDTHGSVSVQVEEYKRPKFKTVFNPVKGSYKLGQEIIVTGKVEAFAGSSISDATVKYRVERNVRFPWFWWSWYRPNPSSETMEITNGTVETDQNGQFTFKFKAIADESVDKKSQPTFDYTVYADVTDINGETHNEETTISVGYQSLIVKTNIPEDLNNSNGLNFSLETTNLSGQPEQAAGTITIHKILKPTTTYFTRKWDRPDKFTLQKDEFYKLFPGEVFDNEDDVSQWKTGDQIYSVKFKTPSDSLIKIAGKPQPGLYLLEIKTIDTFGEEVIYNRYFNVFLPVAGITANASPVFFNVLKEKAEPSETISFLLASPLKKVYAIVEVSSKSGKTKRSFYKIDNQQLKIEIPVNEEDRGNIGINVVFVKNNRVFQSDKIVNVPYTNKELDIAVGSFRSKLVPGQNEEWQITIKDKKGEKAVAELLAGMYDASLDVFVNHNWYFSLYDNYYSIPSWNQDNSFKTIQGRQIWYPKNVPSLVNKGYEQLMNFGYYGYGGGMLKSGRISQMGMVSRTEMPMMAESAAMDSENLSLAKNAAVPPPPSEPEKKPDSPSNPPSKPRTDFNETAFFFPQLATNANGETVLKFKIPESLTRWRMMGLAHTKDLKTGMIEKTLVTQKDLMVFPNPPRFLREGDKIQFSAKISNVSEKDLNGNAELHFFDAFTMKPIDDLLKLTAVNKEFKTVKGRNVAVSWNIVIPEGLQAVVYRITAAAGTFSDGEEAPLPVLSNRMLITESLPLPVRANSTKSFTFNKLAESNKSNTLRNYRLTLEFTSNPAWYAVQALPYLMEFPHECAEQLFSRYYANTLASHIANSEPKIKRVFEAWKTIAPDALKSNLEKNEELKNILLNESPWVRDAANESEQKQRIGLLFDLNRMASEQQNVLKKLTEMQTPNGGWPWFTGMPENEYISLHILSGFGHLIHLNAVDPKQQSDISEIVSKAISFLDNEKLEQFVKIKKTDKDYLNTNHLGYSDIQYFYARTFFLENHPFGDELEEMINYYKKQAAKFWTKNNNYMKAMTALFLNRMDDKKTAGLIMRSLSETALKSDELGMYWRNDVRGWYWFEAPVETQAMLIEAYDEVSNDMKSVDELKVWLLKQKQTQNWKTTKATTEAVYALLLRGNSLLSSEKLVDVTVGNTNANPFKTDNAKPEPGTGYFKTVWNSGEITPEMGKVNIQNPNPTIAWGAMYWQYFEQLDKITPAQTPLKLSKNLFIEVNSSTGPVLEAISENKAIKIGDKIVVRVILSTDRDMEYIHLKDMRASCFEPVNVLSGYRWKGGLGYYESTRDAATNYFISYLPKGTYVFEYKLNATQKGDFSNGITTAQCMYAPEFSAHSEGIRVKVE